MRVAATSALFGAACGSAGTDGADGWAQNDFVPSTAPAAAGVSEVSDAREPAGPPETGELAARSNSVRWFRWTKGEAIKTLVPYSTHICGLSMVAVSARG